MASLTQKKSDFLSCLVRYAARAEADARDIQEMSSYFTDNGFQTGGANAIVDADCTGTNSHLTAALVNAAMGAITNLNLNAAQKTTMRQTAALPIPPATS